MYQYSKPGLADGLRHSLGRDGFDGSGNGTAGGNGKSGGQHLFLGASQRGGISRIVRDLVVRRDAVRHTQGNAVAGRVAGGNDIETPSREGLFAHFDIETGVFEGIELVGGLDQDAAGELAAGLLANQRHVHIGFESADKGLGGRCRLARSKNPQVLDAGVYLERMHGHILTGRRIQCSCRFISKEYLRIIYYRSYNSDSLAFTAG